MNSIVETRRMHGAELRQSRDDSLHTAHASDWALATEVSSERTTTRQGHRNGTGRRLQGVREQTLTSNTTGTIDVASASPGKQARENGPSLASHALYRVLNVFLQLPEHLRIERGRSRGAPTTFENRPKTRIS